MEEIMYQIAHTSADVVIVGTGVAGLYAALNIPSDQSVIMVTKKLVKESDSYLAQGGICVLKNQEDYESYFEDTMKAGHYKNNPESVKQMILSSQDIIEDLVSYGVDFERENGAFVYTREAAHSEARILFHKDITGKEITEKLLERVREKENIRIFENTVMVDILEKNNACHGIVVLKDRRVQVDEHGILTSPMAIFARHTILASGGVGGLFRDSTNFDHLTADALAIAIRHQIKLKDIDYIQIHPTTFYSTKPGRRFLISESVRGEGATLLNHQNERFVDELLPRDQLTNKIVEQMQKDQMPYVWLNMSNIPQEDITGHFPNIYAYCLEEGYDVTKESIPVVPAQHYFMGGIEVTRQSKTSLEQLYAVGETSCNGVHGANRLASNSLLESMVFAKLAAHDIADATVETRALDSLQALDQDEFRFSNEVIEVLYGDIGYEEFEENNKKMILDEIERMGKEREE